MKPPEKLTPLLKQYYAIKDQHPDRILFYRMGDFYELFGDDAITASSVLGIALTSREHGGNSGKLPLAGVPHHTLDRYLVKILKAGYKVAVCDQVEDPRQAKGIVKRAVTEVLTPGSITLDGALDSDKPNFLAGINIRDDSAGLALLDISTGRFMVDEFDTKTLGEIFSFYGPSEIIVPDSLKSTISQIIAASTPNSTLTPIDDYLFDMSLAFNHLTDHFKTSTLEGYGLGRISVALGAAGAVFSYVKDLKMGRIGQITRIQRIAREKSMDLDSATIRNLELVESPAGARFSLFSIIDKTSFAGGKRLLRNWLLAPLIEIEMIEARQNAVKALKINKPILNKIASSLKGLADTERLASKVSMRKAGPRDLVHLKNSLIKISEIKNSTMMIDSPLIKSTVETISNFDDLIGLINQAIIDDPPMGLSDGGFFRNGFSTKLDELFSEINSAKDFIHNLQASERQDTGITSLKVGFNRVFGYYIEVTNPHLSKVPSRYIRKQTLVSAERYITEELKTKEELILNAEEKIKTLEYQLYDELLDSISTRVAEIQLASESISIIDVLMGFAALADQSGYIIPTVNKSLEINIVDSRHPVIETILPPGKFISNDIKLNGADFRMGIITGPNMAGKSTYLRQAGLVILMAQIGAPIPAKSAKIGICDRIFTRVGASDDLTRGRSTFMVEMTEAAAILNNATDRSLILLDELGRGTSTYDGLAIAWSLVEYLHNVSGKKARMLFASHYHELIELADSKDGIFNLQVGVRQWQDTIVFLYKILPGGCDDSYGIQVARLAGLPEQLLDRAREVLSLLESGQLMGNIKPGSLSNQGISYQISLFAPDENKLRNILESIELEKLTPLEAMNILNQLKGLLGKETGEK